MMKKGRLFVIIVWGILAAASASWAQPGYRIEEERQVAYGRRAEPSVVKVYGPNELTGLAAQAIQERRPDVSVEAYYKPLKNKVWIEGTTGSDSMSLSPKRVDLMRAARARGESVHAALCTQQKGVIQQTVGIKEVSLQREYRTETRVYYVQPICPPPPIAVCAPPVPVGLVLGGHYPFYGHGSWGVGRRPYYHGGRGFRPFHPAHRGHNPSGFFHRGHR
ncbi:MAG: hypothetical protein AB9873_18495 [Syntrophobacteraceae bacterium]